jgi:hypothetical protein
VVPVEDCIATTGAITGKGKGCDGMGGGGIGDGVWGMGCREGRGGQQCDGRREGFW